VHGERSTDDCDMIKPGLMFWILFPLMVTVSGCTTYYHVTESDDRRPGWVSFRQLTRESADCEVNVTMLDGSVYSGTDLKVDSVYTAWRDARTGGLERRNNDSISVVSWKGAWRGIEDGVFLSLPVAFVSTMGLASYSLAAGIVGLYTLPAYPIVGGIIGGLVKHTYCYRYLSHQPLPTGGK
jgi:hypothetical protein